jgi:hypothetical protein
MPTPRDTRWPSLLACALLGLGGWLLLTGAEGEFPPTAANGISLAAVMAAAALVIKMVTPLVEVFKGGGTAPDAIRREAESRMILNRLLELIEDQNHTLGDILLAIQRAEER